jgi:hypothetical protein
MLSMYNFDGVPPMKFLPNPMKVSEVDRQKLQTACGYTDMRIHRQAGE